MVIGLTTVPGKLAVDRGFLSLEEDCNRTSATTGLLGNADLVAFVIREMCGCTRHETSVGVYMVSRLP